MKHIKTIALKEFSTSLKSIRFTILFLIFLLTLLLSAYQGARSYQNELKNYNEMIRISDMEEEIDIPKPSILSVFTYLLTAISNIGAIIGIAIGFDAISGERERRTLGFLLTQPIYRDTIINGKFLGYALLVCFVVGTSSLFAMGVILSMAEVYPNLDEMLRVLIFFTLTFLYILTFVVISVFFSILLKINVDSLLASISLFIIFTILISTVSESVASTVVPFHSYAYTFSYTGEDWEKAWDAYNNVKEKFSYLSPSENFVSANYVILDPYFEKSKKEGFGKQIKHPISESLSMVWSNIVAILVVFVLFFISSYVVFLRQEVS